MCVCLRGSETSWIVSACVFLLYEKLWRSLPLRSALRHTSLVSHTAWLVLGKISQEVVCITFRAEAGQECASERYKSIRKTEKRACKVHPHNIQWRFASSFLKMISYCHTWAFTFGKYHTFLLNIVFISPKTIVLFLQCGGSVTGRPLVYSALWWQSAWTETLMLNSNCK